MYVKIIKYKHRSCWYNDLIGIIIEVIESINKEDYKVLKAGVYSGWSIKKSDCEIIDFNPDQISEEMFNKILDCICLTFNDNNAVSIDRDLTLKYMKREGYIRMNRIDEIKEELKKQYQYIKKYNVALGHIGTLQKELIKLQEEEIKKLKDNKNEL